MRHISLSRFFAAVTVVAVLLMSGVGSLLFETHPIFAEHTRCSDGEDNDTDGEVDYPQDEDCTSSDDSTEGGTGVFLSLSDGRDTVASGRSLTYVITLRQQRSDFLAVPLSFHLPPQVDFLSVSDDGLLRDGGIFWRDVAVFRDVTKTLTVNVTVRHSEEDGTLLLARAASGRETATDTTLVKNDVIPHSSSLLLDITDEQEVVIPGEPLSYTVRLRNPSNNHRTTDVRVSLPQRSALIRSNPSSSFKDHDGITWRAVSLPPHTTLLFYFVVRTDRGLPDDYSLRSVASVGAVRAVDQTVIRTKFPSSAVTLRISDSHAIARRGDLLTYSVLVRNSASQAATHEFVTAALPLYGEFVAATEGGYWDGNTVRWNHLQVAPHGQRFLTYTVRVRSDAPEGNRLVASAQTTGQRSSYDVTGIVAYVPKSPSLSSDDSVALSIPSAPSRFLVKTTDRAEVVAGGFVRYTLTLRNTQNTAINDIVVWDRFDPASSVITEFPSSATEIQPGVLRFQIAQLLPGETWKAQYMVRVAHDVPHGSILSNVASIEGVDISALPLTERIATTKTTILTQLPKTGVSLDVLFLVLSSVLGIFPFVGRRIFV